MTKKEFAKSFLTKEVLGELLNARNYFIKQCHYKRCKQLKLYDTIESLYLGELLHKYNIKKDSLKEIKIITLKCPFVCCTKKLNLTTSVMWEIALIIDFTIYNLMETLYVKFGKIKQIEDTLQVTKITLESFKEVLVRHKEKYKDQYDIINNVWQIITAIY